MQTSKVGAGAASLATTGPRQKHEPDAAQHGRSGEHQSGGQELIEKHHCSQCGDDGYGELRDRCLRDRQPRQARYQCVAQAGRPAPDTSARAIPPLAATDRQNEQIGTRRAPPQKAARLSASGSDVGAKLASKAHAPPDHHQPEAKRIGPFGDGSATKAAGRKHDA